jgi:hypothetical protein
MKKIRSYFLYDRIIILCSPHIRKTALRAKVKDPSYLDLTKQQTEVYCKFRAPINN